MDYCRTKQYEIDIDGLGQHQQTFNSATIVIRAQKKVLSTIISRNNAKLFVDNATIRLFDFVYQILKTKYNKIIAEKVVKNIIKLTVKLSVVLQNDQFITIQQNDYAKIQHQIRQLCLTIISFGRVTFSYDANYLKILLQKVHCLLIPLVISKLSEKSKQRLDMIFEYISKEFVLDSLFHVDGEHYKLLPKVVNDLEIMIDKKVL